MQLLQDTIQKIKKADYSLAQETQKRLDNLTKPQGSLGRLEEIAKQMVAISGKTNPYVKNKVIFTMAADHGVVAEGVSAFPKEVTPQMVYNFLKGGAAINVLARHTGVKVIVVDMGVAVDLESHSGLIVKKIGYGTKNMTEGPAMSREEAIASIEGGIEIFEAEYAKGIDIVGTGDMGIGNTTPSAAIAAVITDKSVEEIVGRGTGLDDAGLLKKIAVIKKAIKINIPQPADGLGVLAKIGGFEIGGLTGVILAAAARRVPVVIDGFISTAAALIAYTLKPDVKEYMIAAHCSQEKGHRLMLAHMGLRPLLDLDMRLGEGTGAALGMGIIEASVKILTEMATFQGAGVSERNEDKKL